jgi:hypothetical protein
MAPSRLLRRNPSAEIEDSMEVPAAVVCAVCGSGECTGCVAEQTGASGIIAIVPWERQNLGLYNRLFDTVQATTRGAESFFMALPDGAVSPALRFAFLSEACAVGSTALVITPMVVAGIPGLLLRFFLSGATRQAVGLSALVGIVGFTLLLVGAHAVHGLVLGREASRSRALRFGLYACGWDFGSSPAGLMSAGVSSGPRSAASLFASSMSAPVRATKAALAGMFHLQGEAAVKARRRAVAIALAVSVPAVIVVLGAMTLFAFFA